MAGFETYEFRTGSRIGQVDLSGAKTWEVIADALSGFADRMTDAQTKEQKAQDKVLLDQLNVDAMRSAIETSNTVGADYNKYLDEEAINTETMLANIPARLHTQARTKIAYQYAQKGQSVFKLFHKAENAKEINAKSQAVDIKAQNIIDQAGQYIDLVNTGDLYVLAQPEIDTIVGGIHMDTLDMYSQIDDMVVTNGLSVEKAKEMKTDVRRNIMSGVLRNELKRASDNGKANEFALSFLQDTDKFIKDRDYFQTLFPGETYSEDDKESLRDYLTDHLSDIQKFESALQEQAEREQEDKWNQQYSVIIQSLADNPDSVDINFVKTLLRGGSLDYTRHDSLIDQITSGKFYKDDHGFLYEINLKLDDPTYDTNTLRREIVEQRRKLSPQTMASLLGELQDRGKAKYQDAYDQAMMEAREEFAPSGLMATLMPNQSQLVNKLRREVIRLNNDPSIQSEAEFFERWDSIKSKYQKQQQQQDDNKLQWFPNWMGSVKEPDFEATKIALMKQKENGEISDVDYIKQLKMLKRWEDRGNR